MDDNAFGQNGQPVTPTNQDPQTPVGQQQSVSNVAQQGMPVSQSQQPVQMPQASPPTPPVLEGAFYPSAPQQPVVQQDTSPRVTLQDLYGPSQPVGGPPIQQSAPVAQSPMSPSPIQQAVPAQPVVQQFSSVQPVPEQPVQPSVNVPNASIQSEPGQRLTVEDMYAPSQGITQQIVPPSMSEVPASGVLPMSESTPQQESVPQRTEENPVSQEVPAQSFSGSFEPTMPQAATPVEEVAQEPENSGNGGFRVPPILKVVLGGAITLLLLFFVFSFVSSLFKGNSNNGKVTLTYWGLWEDSNVMQPVIADFQKQHPNITVNYIKQDPKQYPDRLLTRIQSGSGPDIFRFHNTWVTPLQNVLLPLPSQVIEKKQFQQLFYPVTQQDLIKSGAIYGLPLEVDTLSLFVNKAIFDHAGAKVPTTWDDFITVSKALTVKDPSGKIKTAGAALGTFDNVEHASDIISLLLLQNGADLQKLANSQNANDAMTFYTSFAKSDNNVWDGTLDNSQLAFARGSAAMYFGYSWDMLAIKAAAPTLQFAVYPVPHLLNKDMTIASYWVEGISNRSTHQKEALLFMQYLAQKDTQSRIYTEEAKSRSFGELYARGDMADGLKSNALLAPFVTQGQNAVSSFFVDNTNYDSFNGALNRYLGNAINSIIGNTSVDTAMTTLAQGVTQIFNQYGQQPH